MERNKLFGLIAAVIAAVLMAIAGKSCVNDAKTKNTATQRPTIVVSPQIVQGDNVYTPSYTTAPPVQTVPTEPETSEEYVPQTETSSKSKLDQLWEETAK